MKAPYQWKAINCAACLAVLLSVRPALSVAAEQQIHGENSSFLGQGVAMVWGVLRGTREEETRVVLRIDAAGGEYSAVSVEGVDPCTGARRLLLAPRPVGAVLDVWTPRATFAGLPRREIHFYPKDGGEIRSPTITIYFMGLPDTTPEFNSEGALDGYLNETLTKLKSGKGRTP